MVLLNKSVLAVCFFVLIIIVGQNSRAETAEKFPQKFHVEGNKIVDESGDEIVFRGVAPEDPIWQGSGLDPDIGVFKEEKFQGNERMGRYARQASHYSCHMEKTWRGRIIWLY